MEVLLDTHALLWALTDPTPLGTQARDVLTDLTTTVHVSAASGWEIATKHRLGKLPQADVLLVGFGRHLHRLGAFELPISAEHALLAGSLDWGHRDPFDRMLAAQALIEGFALVTRDEAFAGLNGLRTIW